MHAVIFLYVLEVWMTPEAARIYVSHAPKIVYLTPLQPHVEIRAIVPKDLANRFFLSSLI